MIEEVYSLFLHCSTEFSCAIGFLTESSVKMSLAFFSFCMTTLGNSWVAVVLKQLLIRLITTISVLSGASSQLTAILTSSFLL